MDSNNGVTITSTWMDFSYILGGGCTLGCTTTINHDDGIALTVGGTC